MTRRREHLIRELARHAAVPTDVRPVAVRALGWWLMTALIAVVATVAHAPLRDGLLSGLLEMPATAAAFGCGAVVVITATMAAFRSGVPSATSPARHALWPLIGLAGWLLFLYFGTLNPGGDPMPMSKRAHCWLEVLVYTVPGLILGMLAVRKLWPLHGGWTGALLGLAAGSTAAIVMDLACSPAAGHSLLFHALPGASVALLGAVLGARWLRMPLGRVSAASFRPRGPY